VCEPTPSLDSHTKFVGGQVGAGEVGAIANQLDIVDAGAPLSVPAQTMEGVALDRDLVMYTTSEGGGGDASHPQLLVWAPAASPLARLAVTEVAPWGSDASYGADWFELTNTGATTLDLDGVKVDDSSNAFGSAAALTGVSSLASGESAIFFEKSTSGDAAAIAAAFGQAWFGDAGLPDGFKIGSYSGSGLGLSSGGDAVNLFAPGTHVTGVSFAGSTADVTFDNTARLGAVAAPVGIKTLAGEGVFGAFVGADGIGLGSPGNVAPADPGGPGGDTSDIEITEVSAFGSGSAPYAADWIEVTNTGTESVNLAGWKMDDSSALFSAAVDLVGVPVLPAGASAVFFEGTDDAAFQLAFAQAWFGQDLFDSGFLFGHYTGGGVGLSTGGDGVVLFAPDGTLVTGVSFGASPSAAPFATFDNVGGLGASTAPFPVLETLSAVDVDGAFLAVDGHAIGSPGTTTSEEEPSSTEDVVRGLYDAVLRRQLDPAGLSYWAGRIDGGLPPAEVAASLARSREGWTRVVQQYDRLALDREGDPSGVTYWTNKLQASKAPDVLLADLFGSAEADRRGGSTNAGYVSYVSSRVLARAPDSGGLAYWTSKVDHAADPAAARRQAARTILFSPEGLRRQVHANHQTVCGAPAPGASLGGWTDSFRASRLNPSLLRAVIVIEGCEV